MFCDADTEKLPHILLNCPSIAALWTCYLALMDHIGRNQSIFNAAMQVRSIGSLQDLATFLSIASSLWFRRNRKRHEDELLDARRVMEHAVTMQRLYGEVKVCPTSGLKSFFGWQPPPRGSMKLNIDRVVFYHLHKAGVGTILRDAQGKVIMAANKASGKWNNQRR